MIDKIQFNKTPREEIYNRIKRLQDYLSTCGIDAALIVQKADLFYFSGTCQDAHLLIPEHGEPLLMVKKSYERALKESPLDRIVAVRSFTEVGRNISGTLKNNARIGLELDVLPCKLFFKYREILKTMELVDLSEGIRKIRMIKSQYEIEKIKQAANISLSVFKEVPNFIKEGITEIELSARIEMLLRVKGHQGFIRTRAFNQEGTAHILSGWNAACPTFFDGPTGGLGVGPSFPQGPSFKKIGRHEPILIDFATAVDGYIFDQTRIFSIGAIHEQLAFAHECALEIKKKIMEEAKPGTNGKELYNLALSKAEESGLERHFMGCGSSVSFVGHGVGLELDELPVIARNIDITLQAGMVIAIEPKFIFPGEGTVGVEDTFVLTEDGLKQLNSLDDAIQLL